MCHSMFHVETVFVFHVMVFVFVSMCVFPYVGTQFVLIGGFANGGGLDGWC